MFAIVALSLLGIFSTSFQSQAAEESLLQVERKGLEYVKSLAEQDNADAQFLMGWKYYWGDGVLANGMQSAEWFQKSSRQNNALAKSMMGILFWNWISEDGTKEELDQVNRLVKESIESLREQAEQGNTYAQCILGELFYLGLHVPKDYVQSAEWYRKAAEQGNAIGSLNMGDLYAEGSGVPKDYTQAAEWYRKAVEQGSVIGNNRMGGLYEEGNGVPQDYAQAAEWYRKTAEQGDVVGNFNMGDLYAEGNGVSQDYAQAAEWYRKAAEQGNTYAQFKLGHM